MFPSRLCCFILGCPFSGSFVFVSWPIGSECLFTLLTLRGQVDSGGDNAPCHCSFVTRVPRSVEISSLNWYWLWRHSVLCPSLHSRLWFCMVSCDLITKMCLSYSVTVNGYRFRWTFGYVLQHEKYSINVCTYQCNCFIAWFMCAVRCGQVSDIVREAVMNTIHSRLWSGESTWWLSNIWTSHTQIIVGLICPSARLQCLV